MSLICGSTPSLQGGCQTVWCFWDFYAIPSNRMTLNIPRSRASPALFPAGANDYAAVDALAGASFKNVAKKDTA